MRTWEAIKQLCVHAYPPHNIMDLEKVVVHAFHISGHMLQ